MNSHKSVHQLIVSGVALLLYLCQLLAVGEGAWVLCIHSDGISHPEPSCGRDCGPRQAATTLEGMLQSLVDSTVLSPLPAGCRNCQDYSDPRSFHPVRSGGAALSWGPTVAQAAPGCADRIEPAPSRRRFLGAMDRRSEASPRFLRVLGFTVLTS